MTGIYSEWSKETVTVGQLTHERPKMGGESNLSLKYPVRIYGTPQRLKILEITQDEIDTLETDTEWVRL